MMSAPARMNSRWWRSTSSGASGLASSGQRARGTAAESSEPMPPSPTSGSTPSRSRVRAIAESVVTLYRAPMRLLSFRTDGGPDRAGVLDSDTVLDSGLSMRELLAVLPGRPPLVADHRLVDVTRRPAVPDPGKIMCIGRNYQEHAQEQDVEAP